MEPPDQVVGALHDAADFAFHSNLSLQDSSVWSGLGVDSDRGGSRGEGSES